LWNVFETLQFEVLFQMNRTWRGVWGSALAKHNKTTTIDGQFILCARTK
jgi:hypothetical protein